MGMYDTVIVACPKCGKGHGLQTKSGDCTLSTYNISDAPYPLLADVAGEELLCESCNTPFALKVVMMAQTVII